jgi:chemotaxis protein CheZ
MDEATHRKMFTAELQRLKSHGQSAPAASSQGISKDVLDAVDAMRNQIQSLENMVRHAMEIAPSSSAELGDNELDRQRAETALLRTEIRALSRAIQDTKSEIAALRPVNSQDDRLMAVTEELDAIVSSTEGATHTILESAERIDSLSDQLQRQSDDAFTRQTIDEIRDIVIHIFEACNFQDITGQRISKVVRTLKFIEDRVNNMIEIWGQDGFLDLPPSTDEERDEEKRLLNGPALENEGVSQADIDKLFG